MRNIQEKAVVFITTCAYTGYSPKMPGTLGTVWGIPLAWALSRLPTAYSAAAIVAFTVFSVFLSESAVRVFGQKDPQKVVIDEVCGFIIAFFLVPFSLFNVILFFALFRFFDILKPFPIDLIDKKVAGGAGVVLDDVAAGIFANLMGHAILWSIGALMRNF